MTVHVLGMAHTETTEKFAVCAFTDRTRIFASMLHRAGHRVVLYAGEENEAEVDEHVTLVTRAEQREWWPWYSTSVVFNDFDVASPGWVAFNGRAVEAIRSRFQPHDILAITMGYTHKPVWEMLNTNQMLPVEVGIGYTGVWAPYRVFESHAWMHFLAAREERDDVRAFDAVIPRSWDAKDFPDVSEGSGGAGYHLFMGRLTTRKGPHIAAEACKRLGVRLLVAGQGVAKVEPGRITTTEGLTLDGDVEYVGVVNPQQRFELMSKATAVWTPTQYLEPGGGVAIEAQLAGAPVISSDYGCFVETVEHDRSGFRCLTLADYVAAGRRVESFRQAAPIAFAATRREIRERALARYSTDAVASLWGAYLRRLDTMWRKGWYELNA